MSVYIVTGKLGNGKTLVSVGRIRDALHAGCKVATNLDLNLLAMFGRKAKNLNVMRIPDKPTIGDLNAIGRGYDGREYDESRFGLLVLDECGTWFNSRNWQDKNRKDVNDWFLHARKLGWHVYIIIQDISMLDSQARDAIGELLVSCRRLDKLRLPLVGGFIKTLTGFNLTMPRIHRAKVTYSDGLLSDVWTYRGNDLFACYDTRQSFIADYPHHTHCLLTPWHLSRPRVPLTLVNVMRITKIYWKRFASPVALATGLLLGAFLMLLRHEPVASVAPASGFAALEPVLPPEPVNPLAGAVMHLVGDISGHPIFQVTWPDGTYLQLRQYQLEELGFKVVLLGRGLARVHFGTEVSHVMSKPVLRVADELPAPASIY